MCVCVCVCVHTCVCTCVCVHTCVCMCMCTWVWVSTTASGPHKNVSLIGSEYVGAYIVLYTTEPSYCVSRATGYFEQHDCLAHFLTTHRSLTLISHLDFRDSRRENVNKQ